MARPSKYDTHVKDNLESVEAWARDGLSDEEIANNLGIGVRTLYEYKEKYPQFSQSLKNGKNVSNARVENKLFKKAMGYDIEEETVERKIIDGKEYISIKKVKKHIQPDLGAICFYLKNKLPEKWKERRDYKHDTKVTEVIINGEDELEE